MTDTDLGGYLGGPSPSEMPPTLARLFRQVRSLKARAVRHGDGRIPHLADVYRAGKRILRVEVPDSDDLVGLLYHAPPALGADFLAMAADSWMSMGETNPITGKPWELGDMARIEAEDAGLERGLLREAMMVTGFGRDGTEVYWQARYVHRREDRSITWEPAEGFDGAGGRFPATAAEGFARTMILDELVEQLGPIPDEVSAEDILRRAAVTWVLTFPPDWRVIEGPKGPPLRGGAVMRPPGRRG